MNMIKRKILNNMNNEPGENFVLNNDIPQYEKKEKDNINKN